MQVRANVKHDGGFLGTLIGLATKALPTILIGLATGLIFGGVEKAITGKELYLTQTSRRGDGLFMSKMGQCLKVTPIRGRGLKLIPKKIKNINGDGLFAWF